VIVADNKVTVCGSVNVCFNAVIGTVSGSDKSRIRIFGLYAGQASVGNDLGKVLLNFYSVHKRTP
jgi:hypothetical protein